MNALGGSARRIIALATIAMVFSTFLPWVTRPFHALDRFYSADIVVPDEYFRDPHGWVPPDSLSNNGWEGWIHPFGTGFGIPGVVAAYAAIAAALVTGLRGRSAWDPPRRICIGLLLFALAYAIGVAVIAGGNPVWHVRFGVMLMIAAVATLLALAVIESRRATAVRKNHALHKGVAFTP
jgi:hypothetical protein